MVSILTLLFRNGQIDSDEEMDVEDETSGKEDVDYKPPPSSG